MLYDWEVLKWWRPLLNGDAIGCCLLNERAAVDAVTCVWRAVRACSLSSVVNSLLS